MNTLQRLQRGTAGRPDQDTTAVSGLAWVVGTCAFVLTAWLLGASWLGATFLGLPVGLWMMGAVVGGRFAFVRLMANSTGTNHAIFSPAAATRAQAPATSVPIEIEQDNAPAQPEASELDYSETDDAIELESEGITQQVPASAPSPVPAPARAMADLADGLLTIVRSSTGGALPAWLERLDEASGTPGASLSRPLRIAASLEDRQLQALTDTPGALDLTFSPWSGAADADRLRRLGFDALIKDPPAGDSVVLHIAEAPEAPAAWHDWSLALPLSYASLFPARLDTAIVTVEPFDWSDEGSVQVLRSVLETSALLGRYPSRLSSGDRLRGRPALGLVLGSPVVGDPALDRAMTHMAEVLAERPADRVGSIERTAMRVLATYLAWNGCGMLPDQRAAAAQSINRLGPGEGETYLRACVAAFAGGRDVLAYDLMLTGHERLSIERPEPLVDPMEFLISDIGFNRNDIESLGKLAAGLGYSTALIDRSKLPYILDDVRDEVMGAQWLISNADAQERVLAMIEALATARIRSAA
ncbi:MAG: hypothetical protein ACFCBV_01545 [Phycisphaerales bacterium]